MAKAVKNQKDDVEQDTESGFFKKWSKGRSHKKNFNKLKKNCMNLEEVVAYYARKWSSSSTSARSRRTPSSTSFGLCWALSSPPRRSSSGSTCSPRLSQHSLLLGQEERQTSGKLSERAAEQDRDRKRYLLQRDYLFILRLLPADVHLERPCQVRPAHLHLLPRAPHEVRSAH